MSVHKTLCSQGVPKEGFPASQEFPRLAYHFITGQPGTLPQGDPFLRPLAL